MKYRRTGSVFSRLNEYFKPKIKTNITDDCGIRKSK
jgi:hypothetical protein